MSERPCAATIGEIVARDFRAADVFERFGIDFCCGGRRSIVEACQEAAVDRAVVVEALNALPDTVPEDDVTEWPVVRILDRILSHHHAYLRAALPSIAHHLATLERVHGERHPELASVGAHFRRLRHDLEQHLLKEERVLFPYVQQLYELHESGRSLPASPFGTVENPIRMMEQEHRGAADELRLIRELTDGFTVPPDGCTTYAVCMAELEQFERDLYRHVHLENNVLFPKAAKLEAEAERTPSSPSGV